VKKIELKEHGISTLKPRKIWFDDTVQRLNVDERGELIGEFRGEDRLLIINQKGEVKTILPELTARFEDDMIVLEKWIPKKPISALYYDCEKERYYVKRFLIENENKEEIFISEHSHSQLEIVSTDWRPIAEVVFNKTRGKEQRENETLNFEEFITIKGIKALGNQFTTEKIKQVSHLESLPYEEPEEVHAEDMEVVDEIEVENEVEVEVENDVEKKIIKPKAPNKPSDNPPMEITNLTQKDEDSDDEDDAFLDEKGQTKLF
ncbi:MAG: DNA gyrase/topoisomerase IV subunit A, partial [Aquaticitalea sp.]